MSICDATSSEIAIPTMFKPEIAVCMLKLCTWTVIHWFDICWRVGSKKIVTASSPLSIICFPYGAHLQMKSLPGLRHTCMSSRIMRNHSHPPVLRIHGFTTIMQRFANEDVSNYASNCTKLTSQLCYIYTDLQQLCNDSQRRRKQVCKYSR
jgi:hypothetical protein